MDSISIFETLMNLPVFNGVSRERIADVAGKTKLHFLKYSDGDLIISQGENCDSVKFLMSGAVRLEMQSPDETIEIIQWVNAPSVFALEYMYGKSVSYPLDVYAEGAVGILEITKSDFMQMLNLDYVFMLNFLNIISTNAQKSMSYSMPSSSFVRRLASTIILLTRRDCCRVVMRSDKIPLNVVFGVSLEEFNRVLSTLKLKGICDYNATEIDINSRSEIEAMIC